MNWTVFLIIGVILTLVLLVIFGIIEIPGISPKSTPTVDPIPPVEQTPEIEDTGCLDEESKIAFVSNRDGNNEIYVMNADGSCQTNITNNPADDKLPKWALDNNHLVFDSDRAGNEKPYNFYIIDITNGNDAYISEFFEESLGNNPDLFSISPDGNHIFYGNSYFDEDDNFSSAGIYKIDLSSGAEHRISGLPKSNTRFSNFDINLTECKIIFENIGVLYTIGMVNTDGSGLIPYELDSDPMSPMEFYDWRIEKFNPMVGGMPPNTAYSPKWDSDWQSFYFIDPTHLVVSDEDVSYVILTEYDLQTNLEKEIFRFPEGSFTSDDNYPPSLYTIPKSELIIIHDGHDFFSFEKATQEYSLITNGSNPTFSNDGSKMIFERDDDIYSINLDGTDEIQLTQSSGENKWPAWQPHFKVFFSGCNFPTAKEESVDEQMDITVATHVAQTLTAIENQIQPIPTQIE